MKYISTSKLLNYYLPLFLTAVLLVVGTLIYITVHKSTPSAEASWYSTGGTWSYRKAITIDHTKVSSSDQTNFPVLISVTDTDIKNNALSSGNDILFTSADGSTKLDHEIEKYTSSTGALIAWVRVPSLSHTVDTVIYIYYGNASSGDQSNKTGVWGNYDAVWHLADGSSLSTNDSTSNGRNGTTSGTVAAGSGQIDGDADFSSGYIDTSNFDDAPTSLTASAWFKNAVSVTPIISKINGSYPAGAGWAIAQDYGFSGVSGFLQDAGGAHWSQFSYPVSDSLWHYATLIITGGNTVTFYIDGNLATDDVSSGGTMGDVSNSSNVKIGADSSFSATASIDEVRVSHITHSVDWIITEYNNQNSPSAFYSYASSPETQISSRSSDVPAEKIKGGTKIKGGVKFK